MKTVESNATGFSFTLSIDIEYVKVSNKLESKPPSDT